MGKNLVSEWLKKAEHDLGTADLTFANKPDYKDIVCFHCQQAVEKYFKAYLVFFKIKFGKTHNLSYLLDLLASREQIPENFYEMIEKLEDYAVEIRYPDDWFEPSLEDCKEAFEIANKVRDFVLERLKND